MTFNNFILILTFFFTGCASTHTMLVYKVNCNTTPNLLTHQQTDKSFEIELLNNYQICKGYDEYKITRRDIVQEHLDGRKFNVSVIEQRFNAIFNKSTCELSIVTALSGRVPDPSDSNYILNKYYYAPFIAKINNIPERKVFFTKQMTFGSENEFKKYCNKKQDP